MARFLTVGAAQMGPVGRNESRAAVVVRLLELMREAKSRHCDLVVFTECALTPFFPRWWEDDPAACDQWFERELPGPGTHLLFTEAKKLGIAFHLGYAELAEENGAWHRYNASLLVGPDGKLIGKYRKIHLPGLTEREGENPHRCYEKHYFEVGNLGFGAWNALGGALGMCLGNDRRWPETYRMLALQGAEIILIGYNTAAEHPDHPELDHLTNFHSMLTMQAGAYQNGCFIVGVAKAGQEEGIEQIGRSAIISPSGEVVTQCTSLGDELIVHRCDLDQTRLYKEHIFNFAAHREIGAYSLLTQTRGPIAPREPGEFPVVHPAGGASPAEREPAPEETAETPSPTVAREIPADPLEAIRAVLSEAYDYPLEKIEPIVEQAARALAFQKSEESPEAEAPKPVLPKPNKASAAAEILAKARSKSKPAPESEPVVNVSLPGAGEAADDIGWRPGRFPNAEEEPLDRLAAIIRRLTEDYRYPEPAARKVAELAEAAWGKTHAAEDHAPAKSAFFVPTKTADSQTASQSSTPLTTHIASLPNTTPSLSGEESLAVYSFFTEKYGYSSKSARTIAEQANSAWRRWQTALHESAQDAKPAAKPSSKPVPAKPKVPKQSATAVADKGAENLVSVPCPECGFLLKFDRADPTMRGRKARCPQCQTKFLLPESV